MKKIFAALGIVTFAVVGCDDSSSASSNDDPGVESSSSEAVFSSSSSEQFFVPSEYRTCDKKYEGKFLLYQYREILDAFYETFRVNTVFYKCENGKWLGPLDTAPENETGGDVIRVVSSKDLSSSEGERWECNAKKEGRVESWYLYIYACKRCPIVSTPTYYARCEQGDWVLCEPESSSSSSEKSKSSSSKNEESSSSVKSSSSETSVSSSSVVESSSSVVESSSSEVTPESSSSATSVSSSSADVQSSSSETESSSSSSEDKVNCSVLLEGETGWNWDVPKECRFNPSIGYGSMTDERDGKVYKTVEIGDQVWMAENLNYYDTTDVNVKEKGSCYGKKGFEYSATCDVAGRLYTWAAAMGKTKDECGHDCDLGTGNVQGICPSGWHIPTYAEWEALFTAVGGQSAAGKILKSQTGWYGGNGTDVFGFSALPAGYKDDLHFFFEAGYDADFWSATERDSVDAYFMCLYHEFSAAYLRYSDKDYFFSVRCLKNN